MFLRSIWNGYNIALNKRPIVTKSAMAFTLSVVGDVLGQELERWQNTKENKPYFYDYKRTLRFGVWGLVIVGPVLHGYYKLLDHYIPSSGLVKNALKKLFIDQIFFAPTMITSFLSYNTIVLEKEVKMDSLKNNIEQVLPKTMLYNYLIWPAANYINFMYVPQQHRLLYVTSLTVGWNAILSMLANSKNNENTLVKKESIS